MNDVMNDIPSIAEILEHRQREAHAASDHQVIVGASGRRSACRVCRLPSQTHDFKPYPGWDEPCRPTAEALDKFEADTRARLARAYDDLWHLHDMRRKLKAGS